MFLRGLFRLTVLCSLGSSSFWLTDLNPRVCLNLLADEGYRVVDTTGVGQTFVVTLFKEEDK